MNNFNKSSYWDDFYSLPEHIHNLKAPSQFATFVIGEISTSNTLLIDIGCGNGRDTIFFLRQGLPSIGIDASGSAIEYCTQTASFLNLTSAFIHAKISDLDLLRKIESLDIYQNVDKIIIYARFFLHAITEEDEEFLLILIKQVREKYPLNFAIEFRTYRDTLLPKVTINHYRRFIDPDRFFEKVVKQGFKVEYYIQGFGFAKYKNDDAHVARFILSL
jgi:tellurite methyltransferase